MSKKPENARKSASTQILTIPIGEIRPYEKNPRKNENAVKYVKESIRQFGFKVPIVIDANRVIVCGHTRLLAAKSLGMTEVPCIMADDLTDDQIKAFRLADNKVGEFAEWDLDLLGDELNAIADASDINMGDFGFDLSEDEEETEVVEDEVPEEVEPVCKRGEIWLLGEHRLMCGDSTDADAVAKLMNGERADLVHTDPPYGMALDTDYSKIKGSDKSPKAIGYKWDKVIGDDKDFDPRPLFAMLNDVKEQFWWGCDYYFECLPRGGSLLVWQKRDKADAEMIGNDFEICWSKTRHKKATFWKRWVGFDSIEKGDKRVHPTQKPVALCGWIIESHSDKGGIVLDLFGGSGSTMMACEQLGRKCRMMELDPHYCDVIIARWEKLTGQKAVKVEG